MSGNRHRLAEQRSRLLGSPVLPVGAADERVWQCIREALEALASNGRTDHAELSENALNQLLVDELNGREGNEPFFFDKENLQDLSDGNSPRVDVVVKPKKDQAIFVHGHTYTFAASFLALEAKRLPTPRADRKKEYVTGPGGGIERFKRELHGKGLKEVGLIGYVQKHSFAYWRDQINQWVDELLKNPPSDISWDEQDRLVLKTESEWVAEHRSNSLRGSDNQRMIIRHLWVQLAPTTR